MKRIIAVVTALGMGLVACGGGGDAADSSTAATVETSVETTVETTVDISDEASADVSVDATAEASSNEDSSDPESTVTVPKADASSDEPSGSGSEDTSSRDRITSLDEIPQECRDEMAKFLREIEPTVSTIDWKTATISEFQSISGEFEEETAAFEQASEAAGCNDLVFDQDAEFDLMVEFAEDEAPGVVGFFEFLDLMRTSATPGTVGADSGSDTTLETCADGIEFLEGLLAEYDTIKDVPASELATFQQLPQVFVTCDETEAAFFDREDVDAFLNG